MESLKKKTARGLFWGGMSNGAQQLLNVVFGTILGRLLSPSDFGMVGMLLVFSAIAGALQEGGFISALNRKKVVTDADFNAVFWTCVCSSLSMYAILFISAPLIAGYYGVPELLPLSRYVFAGFFMASLGIAPRAWMFRNMMVRENTIISTISLLASGIVAIIMVFLGYTYWSIATQSIVFVTSVSLLSFYFSGWRPSLSFDLKPIREMIGFSSRLVVTNVFNALNNNLFPILLGRYYSPREVGVFTQASKWNMMGHSFISNMLNGIAQPVFAKVEDDVLRQKNIFRKLLRFTAFLSFPAMFGLAFVAEEFIVILLTEKWLASARLMQVLCVAGAFMPFSVLFSNLLISRGHSTIYMWSTIGLCMAQLLLLMLVMPYGISYMVVPYALVQICWVFVWFVFVHREIGLSLFELLRDISPYFLITLLLIVVVFFLTLGIGNLYLRIIVKILAVAFLYSLVLWLLRSTIFTETLAFMRKKDIE